MPVNIDYFFKLAAGISNKVQSGGSFTVDQKNIFANQAQLQLFEKDRLTFIKTGESSDYLTWFLRNVTINPNRATGYFPYPSDFQHTAGIRAYYGGKERPIQKVTTQAWGDIQVSVLQSADRIFPKYSEFADEFRFLPRDISIVMLDYWKTPVKPIWNYSIVNNQQVYNPVGSVDFEFPEFSLNDVMANYLSLIGVNLKDSMLEQFSQQFKAENNNIL
jgi:hypothetical protein